MKKEITSLSLGSYTPPHCRHQYLVGMDIMRKMAAWCAHDIEIICLGCKLVTLGMGVRPDLEILSAKVVLLVLL